MITTLAYIFLAVVTVATVVVTALVSASIIALLFVKVPYVPTPHKRIKQIISELNIKKGQKVYDLGCGDGRFIIAAAKSGADATGYEVSPWAFFKARLKIFLSNSKAKLIYADFYKVNLNEADIIFCFLLNTVMPKIEQKLKGELKPGAKVVSYGFTFPNWKPDTIINTEASNPKSSKFYIYLKT